MKNILLSSFATILLLSCKLNSSTPEKQSEAYYNFTPTDKIMLLKYKKEEIIIFKNEDNDEVIFNVKDIYEEKDFYTVGMGFFTTYAASYFYYDFKTIDIKVTKNNVSWGQFTLRFQKWPENAQLAKDNKYTKYPDKFYGNMNYLPLWNGQTGKESWSSYGCNINYDNPTSTMSIGNKTYFDVLTINSGSNTPVILNPTMTRDVNIIYYDKKNGIIGFDDLNNKHWRLQN